MSNRPSIPAEIAREILVESGHRCAVCGASCPLERAHIIPWHKSREHKAEDLICLCANCHRRADLEKWGEKTLREYKRKPWVVRQYENMDSKPGPTSKVTIELELEHLDEKNQRWLRYGLAAFLGISPYAVQIESIKESSVEVTIELPAESAERLLSAYKRNDSELVKCLTPLVLLDLRREEAEREWVQPPYGVIWRELREGKVVPFLGAGASFNGRPPNAEWDEGHATFLPSGRELAHCLADDVMFPSHDPHDRDDLAKVASYYLEAADRPALLSRLRDVFDRDYQVGEVHRFLADLPVPLLIVTTNYDDLIEQAFKMRSRPFHLVVHPPNRKDLSASVLWWKPDATEPIAYHPSKLRLCLKDTAIIYKMHGSVDRQAKTWDSFVITEEDYVEFLARMIGKSAIPARFMFHLRQCRFLFLGYGLRDWNLRVMLKNLKTKLASSEAEAASSELHMPMPEDGLRSWAIQYQPSVLELMLWRARGVNIYDMEINTFVAKMRELMDREARKLAFAGNRLSGGAYDPG